jgi:hypothetical protein
VFVPRIDLKDPRKERVVAIAKSDRADARKKGLVDRLDGALHSQRVQTAILPEFSPFGKTRSEMLHCNAFHEAVLTLVVLEKLCNFKMLAF